MPKIESEHKFLTSIRGYNPVPICKIYQSAIHELVKGTLVHQTKYTLLVKHLIDIIAFIIPSHGCYVQNCHIYTNDLVDTTFWLKFGYKNWLQKTSRLGLALALVMHGSRKLYQKGPNFDFISW